MGGRRNKRIRHRTEAWAEKMQEKLGIVKPVFEGYCSYCGKRLKPGSWHYMRDEFGQMVKKCNNERYCSAHRRRESEKSFRKAMRM